MISNKELWRRTGEIEMSMQIRRQKWNWIGHILRKGIKPLKERPWIGTHKGKGEGDLDIRGEELSTMKH
jgi:hypothetical protein